MVFRYSFPQQLTSIFNLQIKNSLRSGYIILVLDVLYILFTLLNTLHGQLDCKKTDVCWITMLLLGSIVARECTPVTPTIEYILQMPFYNSVSSLFPHYMLNVDSYIYRLGTNLTLT